MSESYAITCPHCGTTLEAVAQNPQTAPWLCRACSVGWWSAELTKEARATYRIERRDFRPAKPMRLLVEAEARLAKARGSSLREDQLKLVTTKTVQRVAGGHISENLGAAIAAHLKGTQ